MNVFIELSLIGVGLAMDAFAVAICKGLLMQRVEKKQVVVIGLFFGVFQAVMPLAGWLLGTSFEKYIKNVDHWIAFILLAFIGGKMMYEVIKNRNDNEQLQKGYIFNIKELFLLAVATSIDALAVGITFAFLDYPITEAILIIGIITFIMSAAGVYIGHFFGNRLKRKAEFIGGLILVLIGLKILFEHLNII